MNKFLLATIVFFMLFSMIGCSKAIVPNADMFEAGNDELINIKANQSFQITGYLKNNSKQEWNISYGADMFTYEIYDKDGNIVKQDYEMLFVNSIGYSSEIKPKTEYRDNGEDQRSKEYYEFNIDKPGKYTIMTTVKFRINDEEFQITSEELNEFIVE